MDLGWGSLRGVFIRSVSIPFFHWGVRRGNKGGGSYFPHPGWLMTPSMWLRSSLSNSSWWGSSGRAAQGAVGAAGMR